MFGNDKMGPENHDEAWGEGGCWLLECGIYAGRGRLEVVHGKLQEMILAGWNVNGTKANGREGRVVRKSRCCPFI
jgi:hypothetical protein